MMNNSRVSHSTQSGIPVKKSVSSTNFSERDSFGFSSIFKCATERVASVTFIIDDHLGGGHLTYSKYSNVSATKQLGVRRCDGSELWVPHTHRFQCRRDYVCSSFLDRYTQRVSLCYLAETL
jgi:hypothetical protein